jgi:hypothetical protein
MLVVYQQKHIAFTHVHVQVVSTSCQGLDDATLGPRCALSHAPVDDARLVQILERKDDLTDVHSGSRLQNEALTTV